MAQLWSQANGFMATSKLSDALRHAVQPLCRFRQFCDVEEALGKNRGETVTWNTYGDTATQGTDLTENQPMPETDFPISQASVTVGEKGIAVPYSGKFNDLSEHPVKEIINKTLKNDARRALDTAAHAQFDLTILKAVGAAAGAISLTEDATPSGANTAAMSFDHIKTISDVMGNREIPTFDGENYCAIMRLDTMRPVRDDLEAIHQYVSEGWNRIMAGEAGRAEAVRLISQTNIPSEAWAGGLSDAAYFFGADTVTEAITCLEELRGKIPDDYGRGRGIAWYYLGGFALVHADQTSAATKAQARIIKWDSND